MMKSETKTLLKETIQMAWPSVFESFFVSLAGIIDTMMVSNLGTSAVSAIGLTTQPKLITLALFFATNIATSALIARRNGQHNQKSGNEIFITALIFTIISAFIISLISVIYAPLIMQLCGSNSDTHNLSVTYFRIIQSGMIFNVLTLVINAALRGSGNTKIAMKTNVTSSIVNVTFNYLLINGHLFFPALGLKGAAIATVFGTFIACIMSISSLFKKQFISIHYIIAQHIKPTLTSFKSIISLSMNFFIENCLMRIGFLTTSIIAANLGTDSFAAHQVGMNFLTLSFAFGDGMQTAAVSLIGKSLGEKNPSKAIKFGNIAQKIGFGISLVLATILLFNSRFLFGLFFKQPHIISMGVMICNFLIIIVTIQISQVIYVGALRGAGDAKYTLFASLISVTIIRTSITMITVNIFNLGLAGIWIGILADQLSRFILFYSRYRKGNWTKITI